MAGWEPKDYTPFFLYQNENPVHTPKEVRAEYTRQRDIMMKRASRLEAAGMTAQASFIREMLPKLSEIGKDFSQVERRVKLGRELYNERGYSLKGIKQLQQAIQDETGEIVPLGDVLPFDQFMRSWRLSAFKQLVISDLATELYGGEYQEIGGTFSDFYTIYQNM